MPSMRIIGRYEVKSKIARGGMATVYHAYDPRFERDVAIKVLPEAFLHDPQFRVRFEREAKMIALLEHPAIVPVYDFGEHEGMPYIVMRYMSGGSLTERIAQGPIPLDETARIIFRLAPALDAAHARNIIHRDLKPGNILFDQYGNAHLSDFGIARLVAEGPSVTLTGETILGTPAYMSPEQVQGDKAIDGRSDLYALGVLIYHMLTGEAPYQADTPAKVMMMHVLQPVPNIRSKQDNLPPGCQTLIQKAMAKKPDDRYGSASELSAALESALHAGPDPVSNLVAPAKPGEVLAGFRHDTANRPDFQMPTTATPEETRWDKNQTRLSSPTVVDPNAAMEAEEQTRLSIHPPVPAPVPARGGAVPPAAAGKGKAGAPAKAARSGGLGLLVIIIAVVCLLAAAGGLAWMGSQGSGPLAMLFPTATLPPTLTSTAVPPTDTPVVQVIVVTEAPLPAAPTTQAAPDASPTPAETATPTIPAATDTPTPLPGGPIIGGADKVAYLNGSDIWMANLDGSGVEQLTSDGTSKSNLQWAPDGQSVNYISGKCVYSVHLADKQKEFLTCFNFVQYFKSFEISPDGKQVAMSLDNQLYVLPYDLNALRSISVRSDLTKLASCADFAPYERYVVTFPRWGKDGQTMAMIRWGVAKEIGSANIIEKIDFTKCTANPDSFDTFPPPRFTTPEYEASNGNIINFGWNGLDLFTFATVIRNQGFGKLYVYNSDLKKPQGPLNVAGECCYRDPIFSPDGSQIMFAFQKYPGGDGTIQLYLLPYGTLGTGLSYTPIPLPAIDAKSQPMMTLRQVK